MSSPSPSRSELGLEEYEILHELPGRRPRAYVVRRAVATSTVSPLLVVERFANAGADAESMVAFVRDIKSLAALSHPCVTRVSEVRVRAHDVVVVSAYVEGEKLSELWQPLVLEVALRVLVDVLAGLAAIHALRGEDGRPLGLAHAGVSPASVLVGVDGAVRVLHSVARRAPGAAFDPAYARYVAPEALEAGRVADASADVYSVGALLWEAVASAPLLTETDSAAIVSRVKAGLQAPTVRADAVWAKPLVEVAMRALAVGPADRFAGASAMAAEIRRVAGLKVASNAACADLLRVRLGGSLEARRDRLRPRDPASPPVATAPPSAGVPGDEPKPSAPPPAVLDPPVPQPPVVEAQATEASVRPIEISSTDLLPAKPAGEDAPGGQPAAAAARDPVPPPLPRQPGAPPRFRPLAPPLLPASVVTTSPAAAVVPAAAAVVPPPVAAVVPPPVAAVVPPPNPSAPAPVTTEHEAKLLAPPNPEPAGAQSARGTDPSIHVKGLRATRRRTALIGALSGLTLAAAIGISAIVLRVKAGDSESPAPAVPAPALSGAGALPMDLAPPALVAQTPEPAIPMPPSSATATTPAPVATPSPSTNAAAQQRVSAADGPTKKPAVPSVRPDNPPTVAPAPRRPRKKPAFVPDTL